MPKPFDSSSWKKFKLAPISRDKVSSRVTKLGKGATKHARKFVSSRLNRLSSVRRKIIGWVLLVAILTGVSLAMWFGFRASYVTESPSAGGTFSEGVLGPLETLNPIYARSSAEKSAAKLLFSSLYSYDTTGNLKSDLAESVSINDAADEYIVKLRPKLSWSDGASLTAEDVVFTVNLLKNPETRSEISGWQSFKVEAIDPLNVKFTLPGAYAPFLHSLTFPVLPKHAVGDIPAGSLRESRFSQSPIGSGPFAFRLLQNLSASSQNKTLNLIANPHYAHGKPLLDRFQLNVYSDRDSIKKALTSNEIMSTPELRYSELPTNLKNDYSVQYHSINDGVYALFNTTNGVLASKPVRQALALSVDIDKLRNSAAASSQPLEGPILSSQITGDIPHFMGNDLNKAKQLLNDEGWVVTDGVRKKDGEPLTIKLVALRGAGFQQITNDIAEVWRKELQIKVDVQIVDPIDPVQNVLQSILQPRNYDVLIYELVLGGDPDVYAYWHSSQAGAGGLNFANYGNAVSDDALLGARSKTDQKYRSDRYLAFIKRWLADVPAVPLYQPGIDYVQSRAVTTMDKDSKIVSSTDRYANILYWSVSKSSVYRTP